MTYSWINQRLKDLENHIQEDLKLLKAYEDKLRDENDPRMEARCEKEIQRQKESITNYRKEYEELQIEVNNDQESSIQINDIGSKLEKLESKVNSVLNNQKVISTNLNKMQQNLLSQYEESEKAIIAEITQILDDNQLTLTNNLLEALETNKISDNDVIEMVAILEQKILALPSSQQTSVNEIIKNPELDARHRLKVAIPLIPLFVSYEGEFELNTGFDIKSLWTTIKNKLKKDS